MFLVVLAAGYLGYRKFIDIQLDNANTHLAAGAYDEAAHYFRRVAGSPMSKSRGEDGLGAIALLKGDPQNANKHFRSVIEKKPTRYGGDPSIILQKFLDLGQYRMGEVYIEFLKHWKTAERLEPFLLDFAAISLGVRETEQARVYLEKAEETTGSSPRRQKLLHMVDKYSGDSIIPVLMDRNELPILVYNLLNGKYEFRSLQLFIGWGETPETVLGRFDEPDRLNRIHTSLDLNLQKAALQAMKGYQGTMILIDPSNGDLLAAYGTQDHSPFSTAFEPGSVIKILTYGLFLGEGGNLESYAPKKYPAYTKIGGRIFYDWTPHGMLESVDEGMAVSCNLMFARMGNELGWSKLRQGFQRIFDSGPENGNLGSAFFGKMVAEPSGAWELGRAAIGLDFLQTTSLGLARIPGAVANRGKLFDPHLVRHYVNIEGNIYKTEPRKKPRTIFSESVVESLKSGMAASIYSERGTARRAAVPFVNTAMKTGTAGDRPFDSIMIGYFPLEKPRVAFAFYLDKGGKCEINGARVARALLEHIQALAPEYLEN